MEQARDGTVKGATSPAEGTTSRASHEVAQSARRDGHRDSAGDAQLRHLIDLGRVSLGERCCWEMLGACHVSGS